MNTLVDVLVPVLNRPHQAGPFMASLDEPRALVHVIAEPSDGDTITAWIEAGANVLVHPTAHTFAEKINVGFQCGFAPWVLLVGDDCRFTPGWLDQALSVSADAFVIGTTDEKNPRVVKGSHSCHPLISRAYVDIHGASWDGPGVVCHGYQHNYVDDEIVTVAKQRGVWAMSPAVIHHLHPVWGTAQNDGTYRHGQESADQDRALYKQRKATYAP